MKLKPGAPIKGTKIDVAFLGSCTNGRLSDFQGGRQISREGTGASLPA